MLDCLSHPLPRGVEGAVELRTLERLPELREMGKRQPFAVALLAEGIDAGLARTAVDGSVVARKCLRQKGLQP